MQFSSIKKSNIQPMQRNEPESSIKFMQTNQQILNKSINSLYDEMFSSQLLNQSQQRQSFLQQGQQMASSVILKPTNSSLQNFNTTLQTRFSGLEKQIDQQRSSFLANPKFSYRRFSQDLNPTKFITFEKNKRNSLISSKPITPQMKLENQEHSFRLQQKRLKEDIIAISPSKQLSKLQTQAIPSQPLSKQISSFAAAIQRSPQRKQNVMNLMGTNFPLSTRALSTQSALINFGERNVSFSKECMIELSQELQKMTQAQFDSLSTQVKDELRYLASVIDKKFTWSSTFKFWENDKTAKLIFQTKNKLQTKSIGIKNHKKSQNSSL